MHAGDALKKLCTLILLSGLWAVQLAAQPDSVVADTTVPAEPKSTTSVYAFEIDEGIFKPAERTFNQAMDEAEGLGADLILLRLNTYGGAVDVADNIRTRLMNTPIKTAVYITNNAASAGALISIACDSIYMRKEATIGAAVVVEGGSGDAASEKYQSYFREKIRATAESKGRDPDIAEAMVDPSVHIPGVIDSGKILTLTAKDAYTVDFCDKVVTSESEIFEHLGIDDYTITQHKPTAIDEIIRLLTEPAVSGILMTVIIFGIFFELQSPGVGFPLAAAITAAVLYFIPLYLDGLAENWEILLFVVGILLLAAELFVIPGFGVAGILGIIASFTGLVLSLLQNVQFDFHWTGTGDFAQAIMIVVGSLLGTIVLLFLMGKNLQDNPMAQVLIFKDATRKEEGYTTDTFEGSNLEGKLGKAVTDMHPSGTVEIDDERYDAYSQGEWIEAGQSIRVVKAKGISLLVEKVS